MRSINLAVLIIGLALPPSIAAQPHDASTDGTPFTKGMNSMAPDLLQTLVGSWEGTCRTWLEPGTLADESAIAGIIRPLLGGRFVRHEYAGTIRGQPRHGEETMTFNAVTKRFEVSWIDDFHMNYGIMFSEGEATERGFAVKGKYDVALHTPVWGWKTVLDLVDANHFTITAYNVTPDGQEAKAIETQYVRVQR